VLGRVAMFVLPVVAVVALAVVLLGAGSERPVVGARVWGVPAEGPGPIALRLEIARRAAHVDEAIALSDLVVEASTEGGARETWRGSAGDDGVAEAILEGSTPLARHLALRVLGAGELLADGRAPLGAPIEGAIEPPDTLDGPTRGGLRLRVDVPRGLLAAPFAGRVRVRALDAATDAPASGVEIRPVRNASARLAPEVATTDASGEASFEVTPLFHDVRLALSAIAGDRRGRWEGPLPVVPGAMTLDLAPDGALALASPAPRPRAYVSLLRDGRRVHGAVVALTSDAAGFARGALHPPPGALGSPTVVAVVAGDPRERGAGTAVYPIVPDEGRASAPPLELLLDGLPAAEEREATRARGVRLRAIGVIAAAALVEVLLLARLSRGSARRLERHLAEGDGALAADDRARIGDAGGSRAFAIVAALVVLAFAVIAITVAMR
jgi:hypothetical protein